MEGSYICMGSVLALGAIWAFLELRLRIKNKLVVRREWSPLGCGLLILLPYTPVALMCGALNSFYYCPEWLSFDYQPDCPELDNIFYLTTGSILGLVFLLTMSLIRDLKQSPAYWAIPVSWFIVLPFLTAGVWFFMAGIRLHMVLNVPVYIAIALGTTILILAVLERLIRTEDRTKRKRKRKLKHG